MSQSRSRSRRPKHDHSLADDASSIGPLRQRTKKRKSTDTTNRDEGFIDAKASRKILKLGQELADEEDTSVAQSRRKAAGDDDAFGFEQREDSEEDDFDGQEGEGEDGAWGSDMEEMVDEEDLSPEELRLFQKFMPGGEDPSLQLSLDRLSALDGPRRDTTESGKDDEEDDGQGGTNLADLILAKIAAHEAQQTQTGGHAPYQPPPPPDAIQLPAKVVEVFTKVGMLLSRYKSGKLPKPFKILPTISYWEDLLYITRPENWTPNACYEATKIFVSSNPKVVRRFMEIVLLDRVREEIHETKKLNVHLYKALQKATYKPASFFKGLLFPLVESGTCTLREATIVASVLARVSIPALHSSAALMHLTEISAQQSSRDFESAGATNIFIRTLLEKKYALPYKVIDNLVFHFLRFRNADINDSKSVIDAGDGGDAKYKLPVLWHQCLLAFAQRYRNDITEDQREALLDLLVVRVHKDIGPECRRELLAGRGRGVVVAPEVDMEMELGGDDTMAVGAMAVDTAA